MANRWNSWGATSPLWVTGMILIAIGVALVWAARRAVHRGSR